ncbi:hypothetical protein FRC06_010256 [Ceratobasidium sp. 370]|nr:hypothetical protein FRC06_010256 [Ceratobasidium sp. 370]
MTKGDKPEGTAGRGRRNGYNIQKKLGLDSNDFRTIKGTIRRVCARCDMDMRLAYSHQPDYKLQQARNKILDKYPEFMMFDDPVWPVNGLLLVVLKASSQSEQRAIARFRAAQAAQAAQAAENTLDEGPEDTEEDPVDALTHNTTMLSISQDAPNSQDAQGDSEDDDIYNDTPLDSVPQALARANLLAPRQDSASTAVSHGALGGASSPASALACASPSSTDYALAATIGHHPTTTARPARKGPAHKGPSIVPADATTVAPTSRAAMPISRAASAALADADADADADAATATAVAVAATTATVAPTIDSLPAALPSCEKGRSHTLGPDSDPVPAPTRRYTRRTATAPVATPATPTPGPSAAIIPAITPVPGADIAAHEIVNELDDKHLDRLPAFLRGVAPPPTPQIDRAPQPKSKQAAKPKAKGQKAKSQPESESELTEVEEEMEVDLEFQQVSTKKAKAKAATRPATKSAGAATKVKGGKKAKK